VRRAVIHPRLRGATRVGAALVCVAACGSPDVSIGAQDDGDAAPPDASTGTRPAGDGGGDGTLADSGSATRDATTVSDATPDAMAAPDGASADADADAPTIDAGGDEGSILNPGTLMGLVLWLDAGKGVSVAGGGVASWSDLSPHHNDASQPTPSLQPTWAATGINGLPVVHFYRDAGGSSNSTGAGQMLTVADAPSLQWGTGDFYVAVVARSDNNLDGGSERGVGQLFGKVTPATNVPGPLLTINIIGGISLPDQEGLACSTSIGDGGAWVLTRTSYDDDVPHVFAMQRVAGTLDLRVDGVSLGTSSPDVDDVGATGSPVSIGAGNNGRLLRLDGDVAEITAVAGALPASDRTGLEDYLMKKYAL
jgi:hypothetical protein